MSRPRTGDDGLTLVELIITMAISTVVFLIIGGLFISSFAVQGVVTQVTVDASRVQAVARDITDGINSASHVQLTQPTGDDQLLVVRTAGTDPGSASWSCLAWYYSASTGQLRMRFGPAGTAIAAPTSSELAGWTLLLTDVAPTAGATIFTEEASGIAIAFQAGPTDGRPVLIDTAATRPGYAAEPQTAADRCF